MASHWRRVAVSSSLLLLALLAIAALLELLGGSVLLPQGGMLLWIALGLALFLGAQLLMFRLLGLRSRADEEGRGPGPHAEPGGEGPREPDDEGTGDTDGEQDADWRAWRG